MKKVLLGMSGGVDSSIAALLLLEQGYDVTGVTMRLKPDLSFTNDINDAHEVANKLGINHFVLDFQKIFSENVIDYFVNEYQNGHTPNPCIVCNKLIKFGELLKYAKNNGFDYIATGHYSIIEFNKDINRWLLKTSPSSKDQSYVLYSLTQDQLAHTLTPLSGIEKEHARFLAKQHNLPVASKPDSQEICFIQNNDYVDFIQKYTGSSFKKGNFIDKDGNILGEHQGIIKYTIGQRKNLGISFGKPMYVIDINACDNTITLGEEGNQYSDSLIASNLNFIPFDYPKNEMDITAKIRYQAKPEKAKLIPISNDKIKLIFTNPQRSITKGQTVVFYDGDIVVGGGTII